MLAVDIASVMVCQGSAGLKGVLVAVVSLELAEIREGEAERVEVAVPGARLEVLGDEVLAFESELDMTNELRRRG